MGAFYYHGELISGSGTFQIGGDAPIGTVISFMGTSAPDDYLVCDGAEYNILDYPDLSSFFTTQFGSPNYFGGDGATTFAVPDMRNLFLRGYHGEAEEQLSGEIGEKQEATEHVNFTLDESNSFINYKSNMLKNAINKDSNVGSFSNSAFIRNTSASSISGHPYYTSRPVNMAVLFCIKAKVSKDAAGSSEEIYSTEETIVGTWIDGKPIYRITIYKSSFTSSAVGDFLFETGIIERVVSNSLSYIYSGKQYGFGYLTVMDGDLYFGQGVSSSKITLTDLYVTVEYTKTTD